MNVAMCSSWVGKIVYLYGMFLGVPCMWSPTSAHKIPDATVMPLNSEDLDE